MFGKDKQILWALLLKLFMQDPIAEMKQENKEKMPVHQILTARHTVAAALHLPKLAHSGQNTIRNIYPNLSSLELKPIESQVSTLLTFSFLQEEYSNSGHI